MTETLEQIPRIPTGPRPARLCPECKGSKLIRDYDTAEVVCMTCGFVVTDKIADSRPEWRAFDDEQRAKRARTGAPMTFTIHDKDRKSTRLNSSHRCISYAVFCLKKKKDT